MKKLVTVTLLVVMLVIVFNTIVSAATTSTLANDLYVRGAKYGMTTADKVKIERYLAENPVTNSQADAIVAKADEAVAIMEEAGVTDYTRLTQAQKDQLKTIAIQIAEIIDVKLVFKPKSVEIYTKDGKLIEIVSLEGNKLAYTGNTTNTLLVVSGIATIALASIIIAKRKVAYAK